MGDKAFNAIGSMRILGIPFPAILMVVCFVIFGFILARTVFGRSVYMVGGNPVSYTHLDVYKRQVIPRVRKVEGPFGEFPGSYSGCRLQCEIQITRITHRNQPIFENLYLGIPWTEIDYLMALNTSVPLYKQLKESMPEVVAVNAMYTLSLIHI